MSDGYDFYSRLRRAGYSLHDACCVAGMSPRFEADEESREAVNCLREIAVRATFDDDPYFWTRPISRS